jgi:hypothetical protein
MTQSGTSTMTAQRIDRLLRSLVGVTDLRLVWTAPRSLRGVHILRDARVQPHQLIRNIVSGLHAGFGIAVLPTQVHVHDDVRVFEALVVTADVLDAPAEPDTDAHANGNGNGVKHAPPPNGSHHEHGAGNGGAAAPVVRNGEPGRLASRKTSSNQAPSSGRAPVRVPTRSPDREVLCEPVMVAKPAKLPGDVVAAAAGLIGQRSAAAHTHEGLRLERIDVDRRGSTLRCRTVLSLNGQTYAAIAETPDTPAAEAELAARVAVDALRAGGLTAATLEGVGFITIAHVNYCIATVRESGSPASRAGAAPLIDSMAASATAAVLTALGPFTDARAQSRARVGN